MNNKFEDWMNNKFAPWALTMVFAINFIVFMLIFGQLDNKNYRIRNFGKDFDVIINEEHCKKYGKHYLGTGLWVVFIKLTSLKYN